MILRDPKVGGFYRKVIVQCEKCSQEREISWHYARSREDHICRSCSSREQRLEDTAANRARMEAMAQGLRKKAESNPRKFGRSGRYVAVYAPEHPRVQRQAGRRKKIAPYVMEHILVVEKEIGRYLGEHELVHHINNEPTDNRPENLFLCSGKTRKESQQIHNRAHKSAEQLTIELLKAGLVEFVKGEYRAKQPLADLVADVL